MTINEFAVVGLKRSKALLHLFVDDLNPTEWMHVTATGANPPLWIVGHLAVVEYAMQGNFMSDRLALPDATLPDRYKGGTHFDPAVQKESPADLLKLFDALRDQSIEVVGSLPLADFDKPLAKPHALFATVGELLAMAGIHPAVHAGQLSMIRRSLGKPALF